jgi:chemotaxis protein methyltransferase WspC
MNVAAVESWLQTFAGLDASTLGAGSVAKAVRERIRVIGCASAEAYLATLAESAEERHALIDNVIVPETWFFRDRPAFDALAQHVVGPWRQAHPGAVFRILSIPCSTGEEAYSLAMALALAGWPLNQVQIDALDISRQNLARASRGIYGRNSFRGDDLAFRDKFMERGEGTTWRVSDRIREPVRFEQGNLLADEFPLGRLGYDAIFCRNLLIYFDRPTQARAIRALDRLLVSDGWFAVGPAEPVLFFDHGYEALKVRAGFLLHRSPARPPPVRPFVSGPLPPVPAPRRLAVPAPAPRSAPPPAPPPEKTGVGADELAEMQRLADAGRLKEAAALGEKLLVRDSASARVMFLLAVVTEAQGDTVRAEQLFRKTLYLDPQRADALAHLALLADKNGDVRGAKAYRERAQRVLLKEAR